MRAISLKAVIALKELVQSAIPAGGRVSFRFAQSTGLNHYTSSNQLNTPNLNDLLQFKYSEVEV